MLDIWRAPQAIAEHLVYTLLRSFIMALSKGVFAPLAIALSLLYSSPVQALPVADASPDVTTTQVPSTTVSKAPGTTGVRFPRSLGDEQSD